ncbi:MAG: hypothetical protein OES24_13445 [Acidimicrobiia bacterium]|nr:hypothetical protein [Acidimicrobiia bacterium]
MLLLAAAATDQTGRTITMLSGGLIAVAFGLTALTIWYWRFTSPKRRARIAAPVVDHRQAAEEPAAVEAEPVESVRPADPPEPSDHVRPADPPEPSDHVRPADPPEPSDHVEPSDWVKLWVADEPPDSEEPSDSDDPPTGTDESPIGLDSEQWAVLTQAVMDEYLDS